MNNSNNKTDTFEGIKHNPFDIEENFSGEDFFYSEKLMSSITSLQNRHLNDYDNNLLKAGAYKDINNDAFKLEYKISRAEEELKNINAQIRTAEEIKDISTVAKLKNEKILLENECLSLIEAYNEKSLPSKIADNLKTVINDTLPRRFPILKKIGNKMKDTIKSNLPKNIAYIIEIKESLTRLENINKSVDELMSLKIPYGENISKYEQLSKYIIKANTIHSEISQHVSNKY